MNDAAPTAPAAPPAEFTAKGDGDPGVLAASGLVASEGLAGRVRRNGASADGPRAV